MTMVSRNVKRTSAKAIYYRTLCKRPVSTLCYSNTEMSYFWTNTIPRFACRNVDQSLNNVRCEEYGKSFGVTNPPCHALFLRMFSVSSSSSSSSPVSPEKKRGVTIFLLPQRRNVEFHSFSKRVFIWLRD